MFKEMGIIEGFVIQCETGEYLTRDYTWFEHSRPAVAYVHPEEEIGKIFRMSAIWPTKPAVLRQAVRDPESRRTVVHGITVKVSL